MGLRTIEVVSVPVSDQDRAKNFYADKLGFTLDVDAPFGDGHSWVQLTPPGGGAGISLVTWNPAMPPGSIKELYLLCEDIDSTYSELEGRGVRFTRPVYDTPFGRFAEFDDPDGNGWRLHE